MEVREQRVKFVVAAERKEKSLQMLCAEFGISRPTGYLWLKRYRVEGLAGISEQSRRPGTSPAKTPEQLEERVKRTRAQYPEWGARKLRKVLGDEGVHLTASTIHRILLRQGLVREEDRHASAVKRFEKSRANELWQMDFKGPKGWTHPTGPLVVLDDYSRYLIALEAVSGTQTVPVKECLERAFHRCGLPEGMLMDHGVPWWSTQSPSGRTSLALWLMRQGIRLYFSRIRHPQTQGKVERLNKSLGQALARRNPPKTQAWLDEYRWEYNQVRPHEALGMLTPVTRWESSLRRYEQNPPRWEYPQGAWVLKIDCQGKLDIGGHKWKVSRALAGEFVRIEEVQQRLLVYYCNSVMRELNCTTHSSTIVNRWIEQGPKSNGIQGGKDGGSAALENAPRFPLSLPAAAEKSPQ
jgi:transposase InsO family protein